MLDYAARRGDRFVRAAAWILVAGHLLVRAAAVLVAGHFVVKYW